MIWLSIPSVTTEWKDRGRNNNDKRIGWLLDVSIDNDHVILWIKTEEGQTVKLRDSYHPEFYILPRNESDALRLIQILSREKKR